MEKRAEYPVGEPKSLHSLVRDVKVGEWTASSSEIGELKVRDSMLHVEKWLLLSELCLVSASSLLSSSSWAGSRDVVGLDDALLQAKSGAGTM